MLATGTGDGKDEAADRKHVRAVSVITIVSSVVLALWAIVNFAQSSLVIGAQNAVLAALYFGAYRLNMSGRHGPAALTTVLLFLFQMAFAIWAFGYNSGAHLFLLAGTVAPYLIFPQRHRWRRHFFSGVFALAFVSVAIWSEALPLRIEIVDAGFMRVLNSGLTAAVLLIMAVAFVSFVNESEQALQAAHRRAYDLLLNVLPRSIADRLQEAPGEMIAERYDSASVMFVDIVGFTTRSADQQPEETVRMLNRLFSDFDSHCERLGIEKIRTIGDGYMVAAGVPDRIDNHQALIIEAGFAFLEAARAQGVDIRIGANCGELVAGVVGTRRFQYDLWGDTVNVAARMESTGEPGRIHITAQMAEYLGDGHVCHPRGAIEVKGKGALETCFVEQRAR